jgi:predicted MFS family arabinose efflux permease
MSAFALASVVGVPAGLQLGTQFGWHVPFLVLAALGSIVFIAGLLIMPPLRGHLRQAVHAHPLQQAVETFRQPGNLIAFALTAAVMLGAFSVIPYISLSLVANVGVPEKKLPLVFLTGGLLTLIGAPVIGGLADRFGKVLVFRIVAVIAAGLIGVVTNLPVVPLAAAVGVVGLLMVSNAGRMTAAMSMITASVASRYRGGLMSANSAVQHVSAGLGAYLGGRILDRSPDGYLYNFNLVGFIAIGATFVSLWLAGQVKRAKDRAPEIIDADPGQVTAGLME